MRVLVLSPVDPRERNMGSKIRIFESLRHLGRNHTVDLLSFEAQGDATAGKTPETIRDLCAHVELVGDPGELSRAVLRSLVRGIPYRSGKFWSSEFREKVEDRISEHEYDVVWVHFLNMLDYLPSRWLRDSHTGKPVVVLDQHNDDHRVWEGMMENGSIFEKAYAHWNLRALKRWEPKQIKHCDLVLSVSKEDAERTASRIPKDIRVRYVPNGVETGDQLDSTPGEGNVIVLVGSMDLRMNIDAARWFATEVFPEVRRRVAGAEFWIVGRNPSDDVRRLAVEDGIFITGTVEDVRPFYEQAKVAIAPYRLGGGTKLKVLEAMGRGVPLVATPTGAQGIEVKDGDHLLIEEDAGAFARSVVELLASRKRRDELASAAFERASERYSWGSIYGDAIEEVRRIVEKT